MEKFIPKEKLSKKRRAELDRARRVTWGFSPVTRRAENAKKYDRKRIAKGYGPGDPLFRFDMDKCVHFSRRACETGGMCV